MGKELFELMGKMMQAMAAMAETHQSMSRLFEPLTQKGAATDEWREEWLKLFKQWGMMPPPAWLKSTPDFFKGLAEFFDQFGLVPKGEQLELIKKYEALKEKLAEKEETIKHLQKLLAEEKKKESDLAMSFQELTEKVTGSNRELLEHFLKLFKI
jgi:hypothetical protein